MAEAAGVVGLVNVRASRCTLELAFIVVAIVTHVSGVVLFVCVLANKHLTKMAQVYCLRLYAMDQWEVLV